MLSNELLIHATTVAINGRAVLLRGPSGCGKSDLALRLIDAGARLVADDQSVLRRDGDAIVARSPTTIAGLLEVRGLGILRLEPLAGAPVALVADLVPPERIERLPARQTLTLLGVALPLVPIAPFEASAAAKVGFALRAVTGSGLAGMIGK